MPGQSQTIRGTVFRDFNSNGAYEAIPNLASTYTYGEPGIGGITVTAYNVAGVAVASTLSSTLPASLGSYTLTVGNTSAYRIEFSAFVPGDVETFRGSANATAVQFVNGGATGVNLGLNYPADYCQSVSPQMITTCFISGNAATGSAAIKNQVALVGIPYTAEDNNKTVTYYATIGEIGSAWGIAYKNDTRQLFSAAFTKRHVGFSGGGPNAIYVTTTPSSASSGNTTSFFNFTTVGGAAVTTLAETHGNDLPTASPGGVSRDNVAFDAVGKTSLGGMDLSDDGRTLYVVNLKDRKLYTIDVATKAVSGVLIPSPGCTTTGTATNGSYRPFAVKYHRGRIYVGVVCTREDLGTTAAAYGPTNGLSATVYAVDPATPSSFSTVLSFPLTYRKGATNADKLPATVSNPSRAEFWRPWTSIYQVDRDESVVSYPQAWLTDIEFESATGDMLIGLRDRFGDQIGYRNYIPFSSSTDLISAISPGEILRARQCSPASGQWTLESDGALCGQVTSASATQSTVAGPGTGKYYWGDRVQDGGNHSMSSQAGLAQLGGSAKVAMTATDPTDIFNTGGIKRLLNTTGAKDGNPTGTAVNSAGGVVLYTDNALGYGKANGLGDLELACNPAPIQIGNRVWVDTNNNGIQDPSEPPLAGVRVTLTGTGLTSPVSVTTNANGEYYFSNGSGTATPGFVYGLTGLTAGSSYSLAFPASYSTLSLSTKANAVSGNNADQIDSDPDLGGFISFTLGQSGQNNFSFDAGYSTFGLGVTAVPGGCNPATNTYSVTGTVSLTNAPAGVLTITDGTTSTTLSVAASTTSATYSLSGLTSGAGSRTITASYSVTTSQPATATYAAPASCSVAPACGLLLTVTPGFCLSATNSYVLSGSVTATNLPTNGTLTISSTALASPRSLLLPAGNATGSFSYSGLVSDGERYTVTASFSDSACLPVSTSFTAPLSCSVAPVCSLSASATVSTCNPATNAYSASVVVNLINAPAGNVTVRLPGFAPISQTLAANTGSFTAVFADLPADGLTRQLSVSLAGCSETSTTFTAPLSCSVAPVCSLLTSVTAGLCASASNTYSATAVVQVINPAAGTLSVSLGGATQTFTLTGATQNTITAVFQNLPSDGTARTVMASLAGCGSSAATYQAPASCSAVPTASLGHYVFEDVNKNGLQDGGDLPIPGAVVTLLQGGTVVATTTTDGNGLYSFTGLTPGLPYSVSFTTPTGFSAVTSANVGSDNTIDSDPVGGVTAPVTLTAGENNLTLDAGFIRAAVLPVTYAISKVVDQRQVELGSLVTYTISLTNTSPTTATNVVVTDTFSGSALTVVGSATTSSGLFVATASGGDWRIPLLAGGQVATLRFQARVGEEGLAYNVVTAPDGTSASACLTVPFHVCEGSEFEIVLEAPASFGRFQWLLNDQPIPGATSATYSVTAIGRYSVATTSASGCPDGSCCPFVVVADPVPSLTAVGVAASCNGAIPLNDARITLSASTTSAVSYNITPGSSFTAAAPLFASNQPLATVVGGVLLAGQANAEIAPGRSYTVRVYSAQGCYSDTVVVIPPAQCQCPAVKCTPFTVRKVARR